MDDLIAKALHAARHHLAGGGLLSGPDYLSTGEEVSPTNWGSPDVASDFFKADKALRLAREIQAKADTEARRPPIPERVVEEAPALPRAALRVAAEPSPQMAAMLARAETDPDKIEGRGSPEADKIAARAPSEPSGVDNVWARMLKQESGNRQFRPNGSVVTSPKGALGISQVMPSTGPEAAKLAGLPWDLNRLRTDQEYNHALGRAYYDAQLAKYGDPILAAAAYNGGPGRVDKALALARQTGRPWTDFLKPETQNYVRVVGRAEGGGVHDVSQLPESAFSDSSKKMDYMPLNIGNLLNAGAIRITQPGSGTGPEPTINDDPDQWSLVTKYNDENRDNYTKQWPDKPSSYQSAADVLNIKDGPLYDGKYRQILWSANQLGMKPEDIFLPPDREARAEGGEVDAALHMLRRHFDGSDGSFVDPMGNVAIPAAGPEEESQPVAVDNAERIRAAENAARLAKEIQSYEASMSGIRQQPQDIQSMTHAPEKPRAPISVEALGKNREFGSAPYDVAGPLSTLAQGAYDMKTLPLYMYPPTAPLGMAIDAAEGVAAGSPTQVAMGAFGSPVKLAKSVIAPLAVATGVTAPDEAEAARLPRVGGVASALSKVGPQAADASLEQAMNVARQALQQPRELSPLGFYSHGAETAAGLPQAKGAPDQMAAMLQKYGVRPDEMYATGFANESATAAARLKIEAEFAPKVAEAQRAMEGLEPGTPEFKAVERQFKNISSTMRSEMDRALVLGDEWSARPSVTRDEIAAHFKERMPQIEETVLGRDQLSLKERHRYYDLDDAVAKDGVNALSPEQQQEYYALQKKWNQEKPTKFNQYSLPGGENYREVLLKYPHEEKRRVGVLSNGTIMTEEELANPVVRRTAEKIGLTMEDRMMPTMQPFKSQHWDDPNVLAHLRLADRTGPNGEKILHVEEIQSDWGQKGKKEGFTDPAAEKKLGDLSSKYDDLGKERRAAEKEMADLPDYNDRFAALQDRVAQIGQERDVLSDQMATLRSSVKGKTTPAAPYVTNTQAWTDLALKRALREAAEGGYDKLVWTPGAEQAKRYSLSNQVDRLQYIKNDDGTYAVIPYKNGEPLHRIERDNIPEKELESLFGRDVAEKMRAYEGDVDGNARSLSGQNLEVGGSGMKGYYDKIVPNQLGKLVKKLDPEAKIDRHIIETDKSPRSLAHFLEWSAQNGDTRPRPTLGEVWSRGDADPDVRAFMASKRGVEAPSLTITPKMREAILGGQTAFAEGGLVDRALEISRKG